MDYNPFKKSLGEQLEVSDLNNLIDYRVAEGFYVEYKSDFVDTKKIANSIASFANTYGGWYFVGIDADKKTNIATNICGFDRSKHNDPISTVMNAARTLLSHMPMIFPQMIDIGKNRAVLAVRVPAGIETPYINKAGVIYRRSGDASDPIPESDRYTIDRLVDRGRQETERFKRFCIDNRTFAAEEQNTAWANVYLQPHPSGLLNQPELTTSDNIQKILDESKNFRTIVQFEDKELATGKLELTAGYPVGGAIILKQVSHRHVAYNMPSIMLFPRGAAKIHIPSTRISFEDVRQGNHFSALEIKEYFQAHQANRDLRDLSILQFVDFGEILLACLSLTAFYIDWLKHIAENQMFDIWTRVNITNAWRLVPIIDHKDFVKIIAETGLPIVPQTSVYVPDLEYPAISYTFHKSLSTYIAVTLGNCSGLPYDKTTHLMSEYLQERATLTKDF